MKCALVTSALCDLLLAKIIFLPSFGFEVSSMLSTFFTCKAVLIEANFINTYLISLSDKRASFRDI